eukprot:8890385-Karenia_brevis.AAC.1
MAPYIITVKPISDRVIILVLQGPSEYVFVNVYAPPAPSTDDQKDASYMILDRSIQPYHKHKDLFILGDYNARIQTRQDPDETCVGPHTFDGSNNRLANQSEEATNNRIRMISFAL